MDTFYERSAVFRTEALSIKKQETLISYGRLITVSFFCLVFYYYTQTTSIFLGVVLLALVAVFILLLRKHKQCEQTRKVKEQLVNINDKEQHFLKTGTYEGDEGYAFVSPTHLYTYDLDIFGSHSLFQHLNRCGSLYGKETLAAMLSEQADNAAILDRQAAIMELRTQLDFRQEIQALASLQPDDHESHDLLKNWVCTKDALSKTARILSYVLPLAFFISVIVSFQVEASEWKALNFLLFFLNLGVVGAHAKKLKKELQHTTKVEKILNQYGLILQRIEAVSFESSYLKQLQSQLLCDGQKASLEIQRLADLFGKMEHISNIFAGPLLNGTLQYHVHILRKLYDWKAYHADRLFGWLDVLGQFEALNSVAHFSFLNPAYAFPAINEEHQIDFEDLGHPLIDQTYRVNNSISFNKGSYYILTGSNMSGKSTFLRALGVNMVLTQMGAPVCAVKATVHPVPILVSMRLADSLSESTSYFFAEVKRLKKIMERLDRDHGFVLLDEILRGTNSDDKRSGTMAVLQKLITKNATGMIATHDLEVCTLSSSHPEHLSNKRFEVEIVNDELVFDYLLKDGICENKSATFIMKKMEVI